jgi:hypothetical protein
MSSISPLANSFVIGTAVINTHIGRSLCKVEREERRDREREREREK